MNRGEPPYPIHNLPQTIATHVVTNLTGKYSWAETVKISGWKRPVPKPRALFNATAFRLRREGYRTIGEICEAAGISDSTLISWEGRRIPRMKRIDGIRVVQARDFQTYVAACRSRMKMKTQASTVALAKW